VARTLNILDYDTYFSMTSNLVSGDYKAALLGFDEILGKGFSGQTFVAGLNSHLRDLLMCKSGDTLQLLEVSGTLLDRYRQQSGECDAELLFQSIALLTALDGTLRTSSNQRLSIELGLMKLARLGQKKNELIASPLPERFELPDIHEGGTARTVSESGGSQASAAVPAAPAASPQQPTPETVRPPAPPVRSDSQTAPVQPTSPKPAQPEKPRGTVSISGASITSILNQKAATVEAEEKEAHSPADPDSERKIVAAREAFIAELNRSRPRIAMAFTNMEIAGNVLSISVANEILHDEIMRDRTALLTALAATAGVDGSLDLHIEVREDKAALKPIKVEDKLRFLAEKNPLLNALRRELDLEIE
jgi:DNA polymerase-3 subunit gamma/tau